MQCRQCSGDLHLFAGVSRCSQCGLPASETLVVDQLRERQRKEREAAVAAAKEKNLKLGAKPEPRESAIRPSEEKTKGRR
jgi:predicted amidophosphoribosyltransferase